MGKKSSKKSARQRILEAARYAFQMDGYTRTTTQGIAEQASVAEVTIFRHFKNKQTLFQAVVQEIGEAIRLDEIQAQLTYDLRTDLLLISRHVLAYFVEQKEIIRLLMFESTHFPEMQEALVQNPRELIHFLSHYFQKYIEDGQLKNHESEAMAQIFISMFFGYAVGMEPLLRSEISLEEMTMHMVNIFLEGILTSDKDRE
jgi:AcrR family transcriptional regulator